MTFLTPFGQRVRIYRIERAIPLKKMAIDLKTSYVRLSEIETGRLRVTKKYIDQLASYLSLTDEQIEQLENLAFESQRIVKIDMSQCDAQEKKTIFEIIKKKSAI